jgi:aminoglycoside 3-N-acetyltransferase
VIRSNHPTDSFAAWGKHKNTIISDQSLDFALGEGSPLGKMYRLEGHVLLLGVGYDSNTTMHLAEHHVPQPEIEENAGPFYEDGKRVWKTFKQVSYREELFEEIGTAYEKAGHSVQKGKAGLADCRLMPQRELVDFTTEWFINYDKLLKPSTNA